MSEGSLKPPYAACRCGWHGEDRQLIRVNKHDRHRYCPACGRQLFAPAPPVETKSEVVG